MGCTPSIHVSQTGVIYCRESDDSNSPRPSGSVNQAAAITATTDLAGGSSKLTGKSGASRQVERRGTISITEAETQTSRSAMKGSNSEVDFGPMKIKQHTMSVMLVFAKEDAQSDGFWWAADKAGYRCNIVRNAEGALECYLDKRHDVIIIDCRYTKYFDTESLCRSLRATRPSDHTVIIAVTKKVTGDKEEPSILPLLNAGFNRRFIENHNMTVCLNELLAIEYGEVRDKIRLRAANALLTAIENSADGVEVTSEDFEIQYVNPAYERLMGYTCEELLGKDSREMPKCDRNKPDLQETMNSYLKKGKSWEGVFFARRKNGESFSHHCHITPVLGQAGKIRHYVSIKNGPREASQTLDKFSATDVNHIANGGIHAFPRRRESIARIHSMTIEAPITKVINIINAAQKDSPIPVVQALDKVLDILHTTELYSPYIAAQQLREDDQMTSDLVGGLMTTSISCNYSVEQGVKRRFSATDVSFTKTNHHIPVSPTATLTQVPPEIQDALQSECSWDFDIINLERVSQKRPLVYLGLKIFQHFGVLDFLNVNEAIMVNWLQMIEANYHTNNHYHNSTHAADVMQATAYFLERARLKAMFDNMDEVTSLIAAVVHDIDHPGRTSAFLINSGDKLAILYNDVAVLESHHVSLAFQLTQRDDRVNIFHKVDRDDFRAMRQQVIDMVLATEMTKHFEHLSKFVSNINKPSPVKSDDDGSSQISGRGTPETSSTVSAISTPENRMLIKRMLIKCADVSNPTRPLELCKEWARRIADEYCDQTEEEKQRSLPVVMPVFDRKTCNVPKSQTSFIDFFINDMFDAWDAFVDVPDLITYLNNNYKYWKEQEEIVAREMKQKADSQANQEKGEKEQRS